MRERVTNLNGRPCAAAGKYILYWCRANRRVDANHALAHAVDLADQRGLPVLFYERLWAGELHATVRTHTFLLEGVPETARRLAELGIGYVFDTRPASANPDAGFLRLARRAAAVVTDDYPGSVQPDIGCAFQAVDSSCVVPMRLFDRREYGAYTIRPRIHKLLPRYLEPVRVVAPRRPWLGAPPGLHTAVEPSGIAGLVHRSGVDRRVPPSLSHRGGRAMALRHLDRFLEDRLWRYARDRNQPARHATSSLSPYLHSGHISALEVALAARAHAEAHKLMAGEFLEELIVRRELAFNFALHAPRVDSLDVLPEWARLTLRRHRRDRRSPVYSREQFEGAATYDDLWNAAQKELLLRGRIHGYYRMYWGKKIIEWSPTPEEALATMIYLNDRYALDGRDPNSYAGILWCFGLHDRPWPERPIFGQIRYMSREGMERKTDASSYRDEIATLERTGRDPYALGSTGE